MHARNPYLRDLPSLHWNELEQCVQDFEEAWQAGQTPTLDSYLVAEGAQRLALLVELVHADLELRLKAGESIRVESYLRRYPELGETREILIDLLAREFVLRRRTTPQLAIDEFERRFPGFSQEFAQRLLTWEADAAPKHARSIAQWETATYSPPTEVRGTQSPVVADTNGELPNVPGYHILAVLGRGGMGVVYKAEHVRLRRLVALKMIRGGHDDPEHLSRFCAEALAVARMRHPHIVQIHELGMHEDKPFFSLEYVDGGTLATKLAGAPQPPEAAARLVEILARAVQHAHAHGVIHRDLKPGNILLEPTVSNAKDSAEATSRTADYGIPKIADFGLAKQLGPDVGQTQTGQVIGTPSFMAPEQAAGKADIGPACDVYALGAILYEMLTGRPPFRGPTMLETLEQVRTREPVSPRHLQPRVPRDLETICLKCLSKDPTKRFASAESLADDLARFQSGRPILARPVGALERGWRWSRRNPVAAALVLSLILGSVAVGYFAFEANRRANEAETHLLLANKQTKLADERAVDAKNQAEKADASAAVARIQKERADKETQRAKEETDTGRKHLYVAHMNLVQRDWEEGNIDRLASLLEAQRPENTGGVDLRGFEWYHWWRLCRMEVVTLGNNTSYVHAVAYHRDGKTIAAAHHDGSVAVWEPSTYRLVRNFTGHRDAVLCVQFSPDGKFLASGSKDQTIRIWDAATGECVHTLTGHEGFVLSISYRLGGKMLASASADNTINVWNTTTGRVEYSIAEHTDKVNSVTLSSNGKYLASGSDDGTAKVWDAEDGRLVQLLRPGVKVLRVAFSKDGKKLATGGDWSRERLKLWDLDSGEGILSFDGTSEPIKDMKISPDGLFLAAVTSNAVIRLWSMTTGKAVRTFKAPGGIYGGLAFSPDNRHLLSGGRSGLLRIWNVKQFDSREVPSSGQAISVAFSPDSKSYAAPTFDNLIRVTNVQTGKLEQALSGHTAAVRSVAYSPDGGQLASASYDGTVKIWEPASNRVLRTFTGHAGPVLCVAYGPGRQAHCKRLTRRNGQDLGSGDRKSSFELYAT